MDLKYKDDWDDSQRAAADEKVRRLRENQDALQKTRPDRRGKNQQEYRGDNDLDDTVDADHVVDLQLGGRDTMENLWALDKSVNRSLGSQIAAQLRDACLGTRINSITIS